MLPNGITRPHWVNSLRCEQNFCHFENKIIDFIYDKILSHILWYFISMYSSVFVGLFNNLMLTRQPVITWNDDDRYRWHQMAPPSHSGLKLMQVWYHVPFLNILCFLCLFNIYVLWINMLCLQNVNHSVIVLFRHTNVKFQYKDDILPDTRYNFNTKMLVFPVWKFPL